MAEIEGCVSELLSMSIPSPSSQEPFFIGQNYHRVSKLLFILPVKKVAKEKRRQKKILGTIQQQNFPQIFPCKRITCTTKQNRSVNTGEKLLHFPANFYGTRRNKVHFTLDL